MDFKSILREWYKENGRDLPWRRTSDPYKIWISEVILQQTRVNQGINYYFRFIEEFPTVLHLASANEDKVLKVWQGLGYYTRARNLMKAAKLIVDKYKGEIPNSYEALISVHGIGPYSAGAIASFAFKQPVPAIDGNVYRIIARIFGVFSSPHTSKGKTIFAELVKELMDLKQPDSFNQALLDFGALQCTPKAPKCDSCPFADYCYALRNNLIGSLPVKAKKLIPKDRFFTYILIRYKKFTLIRKRTGNDIWHSLYEFPLLETPTPLEDAEMVKHTFWKSLFKGLKATIVHTSPAVKHLLSHQTIHTRFVIVEVDKFSKKLLTSYQKICIAEIGEYSTSVLIDSYLAAEPAAKYFINPSVRIKK